ncbi:putative aldouronate transport system permease protein [Anaerocolumna jejuensis DSM 15929]|uniref:Putative aldouronate transport system permease protein n=2 Tax=Anaerocolumna TaxID=1843210 RepID=A0A1M6VTC6_9FIRM|nr:putative aldouronate transport system permease protein [Anaerocolumna jejuensis DSM 15929]
MSKHMEVKKEKTSLWIHAFFILFAAICIIPFIIVISASLSNEKDLIINGYSVLPRTIDWTAYMYIFKNPSVIGNAYLVTLFITVAGTFLTVLFTAMMAYALSRPQFKLKKAMTFIIFFPTLFSGGLVPSYIINSQYLHLTDSLWALILPGITNVFYIIMVRTFFKQLPDGLFEAAKIDGANEYRIFFRIALSLSKPVLATVAFLTALGKWNEWYSAMLYIRNPDLYPLQYLLQSMMLKIQSVLKMMTTAPSMTGSMTSMPSETLRMAMVVVATGPMLIFFPFFQKYFTKGMTMGSIKG